MSGVAEAVVGGPPCRTVSPCRVEYDGGPPPVRGRDEERWQRWGLKGFAGNHGVLVQEDNVLWLRRLRFLMVHAVAQAAMDGFGGVVAQSKAEL